MADVPNSVAATPAVASESPVAQAPAVNAPVEGVAAPIAVSAPDATIVSSESAPAVANTQIVTPAAPAAGTGDDIAAALAGAVQSPSAPAAASPVMVNNTNNVIAPEAAAAPAPAEPSIQVDGDIKTQLKQLTEVVANIDARTAIIEKKMEANSASTATSNPTVTVDCGDRAVTHNQSKDALSAANNFGLAG